MGHIDWGDNAVCIWIYSFHMPLFFIVSGLLINITNSANNRSFCDNIKRKVSKIMYPYLTFSVCAIAVRLLVFFFTESNEYINVIVSTINLSGYSSLWFLPVLFIAEVSFLAVHRSKLPDFVVVLFLIIFSVIFSEGNQEIHGFKNMAIRTSIATIFVFFGYYLFLLLDDFRTNNKNKSMILVMGILMFIINIFLSQYNGLVDLHYSKINQPFMYYFCAAIGSVSIIIIIKYANLFNTIRGLRYFGKNSLILMATHLPLPIFSVVTKLFLKINFVTNIRYFDDLIIFICLIICEIVIIEIINRYAKFMLSPMFLKKSNFNE